MGINWPTLVRDRKEFMRFVSQVFKSVVHKKKKSRRRRRRRRRRIVAFSRLYI